MHDLDPTALRLPAELTIFTASDTRTAWLNWLADTLPDSPADPRCLADGQAVAEVDAAGVQLLVSLAHSLAARQRQLRLHAPSAVLRQACGALGVQHLLPDEEPA